MVIVDHEPLTNHGSYFSDNYATDNLVVGPSESIYAKSDHVGNQYVWPSHASTEGYQSYVDTL